MTNVENRGFRKERFLRAEGQPNNNMQRTVEW